MCLCCSRCVTLGVSTFMSHRLIHICATNHSYLGHDSFIYQIKHAPRLTAHGCILMRHRTRVNSYAPSSHSHTRYYSPLSLSLSFSFTRTHTHTAPISAHKGICYNAPQYQKDVHIRTRTHILSSITKKSYSKQRGTYDRCVTH